MTHRVHPSDTIEAECPVIVPEHAADVARLCAWFETGALVRPDASRANLLDLVRALALRAGARLGDAAGVNTLRLTERIGPADHYVFALVDGMSARLLELLPPDAFLRTSQIETLLTVFPSTTAAALTSLATAAWPSAHGIYGWWVRFPEVGCSATVLPYVERFSEQPLETCGLTPAQAFPLPSIVPSFAYAPLAVLPEYIASSIFSTYSTGDTPRCGYGDIREAMRLVAERVVAARGPSYTYLYLPQLDSLCHEHGVDDPRVEKLLAAIDGEFAALRARLPASARLVIAADHGLVNLPPGREFILRPGDFLLDCLEHEPVGEPAVPFFRIKPGAGDRFATMFRARFGATHVLIPMDEVERLELLGPGPLARVTRARAGDFIALSNGPAILYYLPADASGGYLRGIHAGLSSDEMRIPLCLA